MKHIGPISGIASHRDQYVATAGYDNVVILWDARTRVPVARGYHDHLANQCAFSPDGRSLVSASSDYTARIWDVPQMRLRSVLRGHRDDVEMATFSPSGDLIATCSRDYDIRVFDLDGRGQSVLAGHQADVISVGWSSDGTQLISSSDDGTIRRWDVATATQVEVIDLGGVETDTIAIAGDGTIFAGDDEGRITTVRAGIARVFPAHEAGIKRLAWDELGQALISLSYDRSAKLWKPLPDGRFELQRSTALPSIVWPRSCAFLGRDSVVFGTFGTRYATWRVAPDEWDTDGVQADLSLNSVVVADGEVYSIGDAGILFRDAARVAEVGSLCNFLLPFGRAILTGGQLGRLFDARTGRAIHQHRSPLNCGARFTRDGRPHAVVGAYTGEGLVFRLDDDGDPVFVTSIRVHDNAIKGLAADDTHIFSVCATGAVAFHRIRDFQLECYVDKGHDRIANGCARIAGGFASIGRDLKLRLWMDGRCDVYETPHQHSIKCIAASADGCTIATGSYGGTVALFDVRRRAWLECRRPTAAGISSIAPVVERDNTFVASSYDAQLYVVGADRPFDTSEDILGTAARADRRRYLTSPFSPEEPNHV